MSIFTRNNLERTLMVLVPLLFTFPFFKESLSTFFFMLVAAATIIYTLIAREFNWQRKEFLFLTIPFWIILVRSCFDLPAPESFSHVKNALFFLLFPIVFAYLPGSLFTEKKIAQYLFILKNICAVISVSYLLLFLYYYEFADFFRFTYNIPKFRDFVYNEVPFFKIHPTYFTAIVVLCCASAMENLLKRRNYWEVLYVILFAGITVLLLVKINMLLLFLLIGGMLLFRSFLSLKQKSVLFLAFVAMAVSMIVFIPGVQNRFIEMKDSFNRPPSGLAYDSTNIRVAIVDCSMELAKENYLWGLGFSNLGPALENCFSQHYDTDFYVGKNYLTHNYFFYIFISSGILGALCFLFYLIKVVNLVRKADKFLLTVAMLNLFALNLSEDFLYRHYGLFFYSLILLTFLRFKENEMPQAKAGA